MSKKCPRCGSTKLLKDHHEYMYCMVCERYDLIDSFPEQSVFDRITVNEETLAEKLVYQAEDEFGDVTWSSTIVSGWYVGREDCIAATVKRLKEVSNDHN